jgi:uncharacterized protein
MTSDQGWRLRLAVLSTLVKESPKTPGRTALMKFAFLLQTIRGVPLGYRFELYNYGPYNSTVLGDISQAITLRAIKSKPDPSGYGYEFTSKDKGHSALRSMVSSTLEKYDKDIKWVLKEFGNKSASQLELISTIVFADQEMRRKRQPLSNVELSRRVKQIKPHFTDGTIKATINELLQKNLVLNTSDSSKNDD